MRTATAGDPVAGPDPSGVLIFIPTYADRSEIGRLVAEVEGAGQGWRALVVDDGSNPPVPVVAEHGLHVRLPANFGLGVSTRLAFEHALRWNYAAVVRVDADGQHSSADIPRLLEALKTADLVVGTRTNEDRGLGGDVLARRAMKGYFNAIARIATHGRAPSDVNSGMFAASRTAMEKLCGVPLERFPEPSMVIAACRAGLRVAAVPIQQQSRRQGQSSINVMAALAMFFRFNVSVLVQLLGRRQ